MAVESVWYVDVAQATVDGRGSRDTAASGRLQFQVATYGRGDYGLVDDDGGGDIGPFDKRLTRSKLDGLYGKMTSGLRSCSTRTPTSQARTRGKSSFHEGCGPGERS